MYKATSLMMSVALVALSLVAVAPNVSAGTATFYLTNVEGSAHKELVPADPNDPTAISLANGASQIWVATIAASTTADFSGTSFSLSLSTCDTGAGGASWTPGSWDGTTFTPLASSAPGLISAGIAGCQVANYQVNTLTGNREILEGNFLAVEIVDSDDSIQDVATEFNFQGSSVTTGDTTPSYPTPSLATIVLLSAGILMVGGVVYRRKRQA